MAKFTDETSRYVTVDGKRYMRTNGRGSMLSEVTERGDAWVVCGAAIHADDPRHPDAARRR